MLTVDEHDLIRRKHLMDGISQRAIAHPIPPGYRLANPRPKPTIDPLEHIIEAWIEQDELGRPKQSHMGQRIFERLRDEHDIKGSVVTVRRYVRKLRKHNQEVYISLAFEPSEKVQVDWHEGWIENNGVQRKAHSFCMRLGYSKASFVWAYERADQESFLDGQVRALERRVPDRLPIVARRERTYAAGHCTGQ